MAPPNIQTSNSIIQDEPRSSIKKDISMPALLSNIQSKSSDISNFFSVT
jgi:hypothetical protein